MYAPVEFLPRQKFEDSGGRLASLASPPPAARFARPYIHDARYARQTTPTRLPKLPNKTSRPSVKPRPQWPLCKSAIFQFPASATSEVGSEATRSP